MPHDDESLHAAANPAIAMAAAMEGPQELQDAGVSLLHGEPIRHADHGRAMLRQIHPLKV